MTYDWNFIWVWNNAALLLRGLAVTLELALATCLVGFPCGLLLSTLTISRNRYARRFGYAVVEIARDIPVLVSMVWLYFCAPALVPILHISPFWIASLALGANFAALEAEILRAGYKAIPQSQIDVARTLGLSRVHVLRWIIIPQAIWRSVPATLGQIVNTIKLSSLASFITVPELFYTTGALIQTTFRPLEFYTAMALLYLLLIVPLSGLTHLSHSYITRRYDG